jgi:hypothetical protein
LLFLSVGCAAVALTGAGLGITYTLTNVAQKTFSAPIDQVDTATIEALHTMEIKVVSHAKGFDTSEIEARTVDLDISITLKKITSATTRIKVDAKKDVLLKDKATATEIIAQVDNNLKE